MGFSHVHSVTPNSADSLAFPNANSWPFSQSVLCVIKCDSSSQVRIKLLHALKKIARSKEVQKVTGCN